MGWQVDNVTVGLAALLAVLAYAYTKTNRAPDVYPIHLRQQADVSRTRNKGESAIYRSRVTPNGTPLLQAPEAGVKTAYDMFQVSVKRRPSKEYLGRPNKDGKYEYFTFSEINARVTHFGSGLISFCKLATGKETPVGIYHRNSVEWAITDLACCAYSLISVPMYDTFDSEALQYIIMNTSISVVVVGGHLLERLLSIASASPVMKYVIVADMPTLDPNIVEKAAAIGVTILTFEEVEVHGKAHLLQHVPPKASDLMTICYTSGTTGTPKGVMLTHLNITSAGAGLMAVLPPAFRLTEADRHLSYLPASHMFERNVFHCVTYHGLTIGFSRGDVAKLFEDIASFRPTIFPSVPRLLVRLHDRIRLGIDRGSPLVRFLFNMAYSMKKRELNAGRVSNNTIWDRLVFKRIQNLFGGQLRFMITGAAPISTDVIEFLRIIFGCQVLEGFGATETTAAGLITMFGDYSFAYGSHVGTPFASCEIKLIDAPSMNYLTSDQPNPRGELCIRGPLVMSGYYKEPVKTAEALDADGWFHTGDVAEILPNGTTKIIDRIKNLFKLSQGEYCAPEKIETKIKTQFVAQVWLYGEPVKSACVAIVVPDLDNLVPWAKQNGLTHDPEELIKLEKVRNLIHQDMLELGKDNGLLGFELPKAITLTTETFTVENGLLTPTFKSKRPQLKSKFQKELDAMYKELGL
ncbi:hypothetical protein SmJEL517_g05152 [Synchytrium microbalum]|uniref:Long-chain-fatty-acid--CoA ligase n=1 Tax=Synchytrium microbalum TaxID=1806994 RepID=A0A507BMX9_9FUNG|nr:uncharacterized protein SmJEL517_g05152 [Synchytrium microbalum]TPX31530.1 hypothetical protein SmJEL517_g05152 [Synchytrium microbalum]